MDFSPFQLHSITPKDDASIAAIVRYNLKRFHLDLPGTVYFDPELDHLSAFYTAHPEQRGYFILTDSNHAVVGGVGYAEFSGFPNCCELQKLYLADAVKGFGLGKKLMHFVVEQASKAGYRTLYLETHTNLATAVHIYEKMGFRRIEKPDCVRHNTMNTFFLMEL